MFYQVLSLPCHWPKTFRPGEVGVLLQLVTSNIIQEVQFELQIRLKTAKHCMPVQHCKPGYYKPGQFSQHKSHSCCAKAVDKALVSHILPSANEEVAHFSKKSSAIAILTHMDLCVFALWQNRDLWHNISWDEQIQRVNGPRTWAGSALWRTCQFS